MDSPGRNTAGTVKGMLTSDQLAEMHEVFDLFDKDGDGTINTQEFKVLFRCFGIKLNDEQIEVLVNEYDADGSGEIDFDEFCEMMSKVILDDGVEPELEETYKVFNSDTGETDNGINAQELQNVLRKFNYEITLQEAMDVINEADWDGDGHLNF